MLHKYNFHLKKQCGNISSICSSNSEVNASELLEHIEEMLPLVEDES